MSLHGQRQTGWTRAHHQNAGPPAQRIRHGRLPR